MFIAKDFGEFAFANWDLIGRIAEREMFLFVFHGRWVKRFFFQRDDVNVSVLYENIFVMCRHNCKPSDNFNRFSRVNFLQMCLFGNFPNNC